ncbi:10275_t:CDS:2, partial [Gigaspora rosea]
MGNTKIENEAPRNYFEYGNIRHWVYETMLYGDERVIRDNETILMMGDND